MRPTFGPLLVLIATWLTPAVAAWGQLNCTSCNPQFLEAESGTLDTSCTAGRRWTCSLISWTTPWIVRTGFSTAVAKFPLGNERECNGNRPEDLPYFFGTVHLHNFESTGLANSDAFVIDGAGGHVDQTLRQHRHLRGPHHQWLDAHASISNGTGSGNVHLWRRVDVPRRQHQLGRLRQHRGREMGHLASQTADVQMVGLNGLAGHFLLVQNSSVDVSHPFQVGTNAHGFSTGTEGVAGDFGWSTCVGSVVYGGFGQVSVEFDSCVQHEGTCASDLDAVGRYVVGNHAGYVEATRTVNLIDNAPPVFTGPSRTTSSSNVLQTPTGSRFLHRPHGR